MNFYTRILFSSLIICILTAYGFSQEGGKITGKVTDNESKGIEADVKVLKSGENTFVSGAKCNADGSFEVYNLKFGTYKMEISFMGYASLSVDNIVIDPSHTLLSFDTLKLKKQDITTEEIDVEGEKGLIQLSADKKIFNVDQSILTKGGTALDVLKKTPLVDVDINDNVSLRGSQNVKILIDDKPSRYASLKQVPADAIERIELITNPPAKYEAEGVTGIINIVMKKNDRLGFTGSVNAGSNYSDKLAGWGGLDLNLKKKKVSFFGNFYSGTWANNFSYHGNTDYFNEPSSLTNTGDGKNHGYWIWSQGGLEYELSQGKTIGFEGSIATGKWYNADNSRSDVFNSAGQLSSYYTQLNDRNGLWQNITGSVYYNGKINDEGKELTGNFSFSRNRNDFLFNLFKSDFDSLSNPAGNDPLDQFDTTLSKSYNINVQTDYVHPFSQLSKLETGYKGTFRINDNNFTSDTLDYPNNQYVSNLSADNHFKLNEFINAVYAQFSSSIGNFSYKFGLRAEHTNTKGELLTNGNEFKQDYIDFFPSVSFSQKIGPGHQVQLSYSRRVTRPNIWRMNPFVRKWNARYISVGNPELKPEYTDAYELSFMFYSNIITVTPLAFYRRSKDVISNYNYLIDSNVQVQTFLNAAGTKSYGVDLLLSSRSLSWFTINGTLSLYNTKFDNDAVTDYAAEEGFSWKANVRSTFTVGTLFNLELFYQYTGKKVNAQGTDIPNQNFDIGISKSFLNDALTISLKASDIFNTSEWGQDITTPDYATISRQDWSSRQASLNLSYRFGNTKDFIMKKKKVKQNSNENNDSQDNNSGR